MGVERINSKPDIDSAGWTDACLEVANYKADLEATKNKNKPEVTNYDVNSEATKNKANNEASRSTSGCQRIQDHPSM